MNGQLRIPYPPQHEHASAGPLAALGARAIRSFAMICGLILLWAPVALAGSPTQGLPPPYSATYELYRDGDIAGRGSMSLEALGQNRFRNTSVTEATRGFAGFLGGRVDETSTWELHQGQPRALRYEYRQKVAFSNRRRESVFDHQAGRVHGVNKDEPWELPLRDGAMDRLLTNFLMIADVARGTQSMTYLVAERGRYKEYTYRRAGRERITTPLGSFEAIRVEREHRDPKRQTISWHAPDYEFLPVRIVHLDDDEHLQLDIQSVRFE